MKKILSIILVIFIFALFTPTAFAQGEYVVDDADLLTEDMEATLTSQISSINEAYNIDVVIHTTMSTDGAIVDYQSEPMSPVVKEVIVIVLALVVAFVVTAIMKSKMNTAVIKNEASDYVKQGSMNVTQRLDVFTHRHVTKTAKPKNNSSGGRSGGGSRSGGGGGKF